MATLLEDIKKSSDWLIAAFKSLGKDLDYSIESLKLVDEFFDEQTAAGKVKPGGLLESGFGGKIFSIAAYVGEVIIRNTDGSQWVTDDSDPDGEINIQIKFSDGSVAWPGQKVIKRIL
ncbi:MAG TPA: hypothetical protein VJC17_02625 [Candidatus Dojkabacteria bacterium]|nr:hypothetical protein [Candidatus Dojkabacteria bacterium]